MHMKLKKPFFMLLIFVIHLALCSCSSNRSTVTTETRTIGSGGSESLEVTKKEENLDNESTTCAGVLSCTVDFLGDVIAFPFRLVGGLMQAIF